MYGYDKYSFMVLVSSISIQIVLAAFYIGLLQIN